MRKIILFLCLVLIIPLAGFSAPTMEWGNMIGDSTNAPAVYRSSDGRRLDFTVINCFTKSSCLSVKHTGKAKSKSLTPRC